MNIVATKNDGERYGLTATAVTSVTADPAVMLCCVNKSASSAAYFKTSGCFSINILTVGQQEIAAQFASSKRVNERFSTGNWIEGSTGAPILEGAVASFDCELLALLPAYSHLILMGQVIQSRSQGEEKALIYSNGSFGHFVPN